MEGLDGVRVVKMETREAYEEARVAAVVDAPPAAHPLAATTPAPPPPRRPKP